MMGDGSTEHQVTQFLDRARQLLNEEQSGAVVVEFFEELDQLDARTFVRLDERSRSYSSGLWEKPRSLMTRWRSTSRESVRPLLSMMSGDGFKREIAVQSCDPTRRAQAALLLVRCTDWVTEVKIAAEQRLGDIPKHLLLELLALAEHLVRTRYRSEAIASLLDSQLGVAELRHAVGSADPAVSRIAWRRLVASPEATRDELRTAALNDDVMVRAHAATILLAPGSPDREWASLELLQDPVGWLAARALSTRIDLYGDRAVEEGLLAASPTVRARALDWSRTRPFDARAVYRTQLDRLPEDSVAITGLANIADAGDIEVFRAGLRHSRSSVRAACLRAIARVEPGPGQEYALETLLRREGGRVSRVAAAILRDQTLSDRQASAIEHLVADSSLDARLRWRALSTLRRNRWRYLAALLRWLQHADDGERTALRYEVDVWIAGATRLGAPPDSGIQLQIEAATPDLSADAARQLSFLLRSLQPTSSE